MADISTLWNTTRGDWSLAGADTLNGNDIITAVLISLFTDRLAGPDDLPAGSSTDPRGWWADAGGQLIGSRLWLLERSKRLPSVLQDAEAYAKEALQWLLDDGVASRIEVSAEWTTQTALGLSVIVYSPSTGAPIVKVGSQNIFGVPHVDSWGWNPKTGTGVWTPVVQSTPSAATALLLDGSFSLDNTYKLTGARS